MEILETEITNKETLTKTTTADAPSPSLSTTYYPPKYSTAQTKEYRQVMFHIRNMQVLKTSHRIAIQQFSREQLLEMVEIYDLIMKNVNYLFD
jgi:hypothetical protein